MATAEPEGEIPSSREVPSVKQVLAEASLEEEQAPTLRRKRVASGTHRTLFGGTGTMSELRAYLLVAVCLLVSLSGVVALGAAFKLLSFVWGR